MDDVTFRCYLYLNNRQSLDCEVFPNDSHFMSMIVLLENAIFGLKSH